MGKKLGVTVLAGTFLLAAALPMAAWAGKGNGTRGGQGNCAGDCQRLRKKDGSCDGSGSQSRDGSCTADRQRKRDGSCGTGPRQGK